MSALPKTDFIPTEFFGRPNSPEPLSAEQIAQYEHDGFLLVKNVLTSGEVEYFKNHLLDIINRRVARPEHMLVMKDVAVAKGRVETDVEEEKIQKIQDIQSDPVWMELLQNKRLLDISENWCGPNMKTIHNMVINKPPNLDGRHPFHQDMLYFPFRPVDRVIGVWVPLEAVNRENGTLAVIPGSHKLGLLEHGAPKGMGKNINMAYLSALGHNGENYDLSQRIHIEAEAGDALFFHPLLLHGTGTNRTEGFRRVFINHYASCECSYLPNGEQMAAIRHYTLVRGKEIEGGL